MASPAGSSNASCFLFKPPSPNPTTASPPPSSFGATPPHYPAAPPASIYSYPPASPMFHHHHNPYLNYQQDHPLHRPTPPFSPTGAATASPSPNHPSPVSNPKPSNNQNPGAILMAAIRSSPTILETAVSMPPPSAVSPDYLTPLRTAALLNPVPSAPPATLAHQVSPAGLPSIKSPRGRLLGSGERAIFDVDSRLPSESEPPQLEVAPITKYTSDPLLVLGRQIAVNGTYISYGLKLGAIRVLNINTATRSLLKGHSQKVTDICFFADDVHLLASVSVDGRVFVWKIEEGHDEENKPQITGKIVVAIHIIGDAESYHPRICWHSHKQEILFIGIGNRVLKIDTTRVGRGKKLSAEEPLRCNLEKLIDGAQLIGKHDAEVMDLSISQWMITRLASASKDGLVKIWDDRRATPLSTFRAHDGLPVNSVSFMTSPDRPDHIILITAGPLNREVKIWTSASNEGWVLPSDSGSWKCSQTLELRSSSEPQLEEAFFNQIVVLPRASFIIIANAKKNAIYAVHVDYGPNPAATRMDYIADFTTTMPILSLTGTYDSEPKREQIVQIYCVQTQAIQQYALDLVQCLPPPNFGSGKDLMPQKFESPGSEGPYFSDSFHGPTMNNLSMRSASAQYQHLDTIIESVSVTSNSGASDNISRIPESATSPKEIKSNASPFQSSDANAGRLSGLITPQTSTESRPPSGNYDINQAIFDYSVNRIMDSVVTILPDFHTDGVSGKGDSRAERSDVSLPPNDRHTFQLSGTTHLVTPEEIFSGVISSSESNQVSRGKTAEEVELKDMIIAKNNIENEEVKVKLIVDGRSDHQDELGSQQVSQVCPIEDKDKPIQSSDSNLEAKYGCSAMENFHSEESHADEDVAFSESMGQRYSTDKEEYSRKDETVNTPESSDNASSQSVAATMEKILQTSGDSTTSASPFNSIDSLNVPENSTISVVGDVPQILTMQNTLKELLCMQKEMQKQIGSMVAAPVVKEGKRLEASLDWSMEKVLKANLDALWARFQEETSKHEKIEKERMQQITLLTNFLNKDLPAMLKRSMKKEIASVGQVVGGAITPIISSAIAESFQKGVGDKAVNQLEKSVATKLEAAVARKIQAQFQVSGKQALQDALRSCLESSVIPAFEQSCRAMFDRVDTSFHKGMSEYITSTQQQFDAAHTPLAHTLREAINSASSITQNVTTELIDGQHKLLALVAAGNNKALVPATMQRSNGLMGGLPEMALSVQQVEAPLDPKKELSRLISERKYEEAFTMALQRTDVSIVSWLCMQVDLHAICSTVPLPLSQGVLLALTQQLACDINKETSRKVTWMTDVAVAINPSDPMISQHVRPISEQVYNILGHQRSLPTTTPSEASNLRLIMHVINSVLLSCK